MVALLAACSSEPAVVNDLGAANDNAPPQRSLVYDGADVISDAAEARLRERIVALEKATSDELFVWTVPSLEGRTIEEVGLELGNALGVGKPDLDNGVLILASLEERRVRIEVGYGLEGLLTDQKAAQIIETNIVPAFSAGSFDRGFESGTDAIADLLEADTVRPRYLNEERRAAAQ